MLVVEVVVTKSEERVVSTAERKATCRETVPREAIEEIEEVIEVVIEEEDLVEVVVVPAITAGSQAISQETAIMLEVVMVVVVEVVTS